MESDKNIENSYWFTNRQTLTIIIACILGTASVVKVHAEFEYREQRYKADKLLLENEVLVLSDRLDKKIKIINSNTEEINRLKQKGSDE